MLQSCDNLPGHMADASLPILDDHVLVLIGCITFQYLQPLVTPYIHLMYVVKIYNLHTDVLEY